MYITSSSQPPKKGKRKIQTTHPSPFPQKIIIIIIIMYPGIDALLGDIGIQKVLKTRMMPDLDGHHTDA